MAWAVLSAPKTTVSRGTAQEMQRYAAGCWNGDYPEYSKINSRTILCKLAKILRACFFYNYSAICKKPLKRLEEAVGETSSTGLKSGVNEKIHLLHTAE